jgi:hypothetical protein
MGNPNQPIPDYVNYQNGSQFPSFGGGLYFGIVTGVTSGLKCSVKVQSLGLTIKDIPYLSATALNRPVLNDAVIVGFLEQTLENAVVLGKINVSVDVFASKTSVTSLQNQLTALAARVTALENQ